MARVYLGPAGIYSIAMSQEEIDAVGTCLQSAIQDVEEVAQSYYREYCSYCGRIQDVRFRIYDADKCEAWLRCGHVVKSGDIDAEVPLDAKLGYDVLVF